MSHVSVCPENVLILLLIWNQSRVRWEIWLTRIKTFRHHKKHRIYTFWGKNAPNFLKSNPNNKFTICNNIQNMSNTLNICNRIKLNRHTYSIPLKVRFHLNSYNWIKMILSNGKTIYYTVSGGWSNQTPLIFCCMLNFFPLYMLNVNDKTFSY